MAPAEHAILFAMSEKLGGLIEAVDTLQVDLSELTVKVETLTTSRNRALGFISAFSMLGGVIGSLGIDWLQLFGKK